MPVVYRNDNVSDWFSNGKHVSFIELHGPVLGSFSKGCMHCYTMHKHGSVSPSQQQSNDCPFNKFIFDDPAMVDGIPIIYFYGKKIEKIQKILCLVT